MVVLHVGTNNVDNSAEEIRDGILEIVKAIREKHPNAYIVLPVSFFLALNVFRLSISLTN